jgi:hypothetical protein
MVLFSCVLIVLSFRRESLKLILVDEPLPKVVLSHFVNHSRPKYIANLAHQNHKWLTFWLAIFEWLIITLGDE